ncbi:MAG: hypothetical protein ACT4QF_12710 [Sporichthyaceae bacterium]
MGFDRYVLAPNGPRTVGRMRALIESSAEGLEPESDADFWRQLDGMDRAERIRRTNNERAWGFAFCSGPSWRMGRSRGFAETAPFFVLDLRRHLADRDDAWEPPWHSAFGGRAIAINVDPPPPGFEVHEWRDLVVQLATHFRLRLYDPRADEIYAGHSSPLQRLRRPDPSGP